MQCPNCVTQALVTSQRRDIEIDHCPKCGGVWLDRGELEKVVALASEEHGSGRDWGRTEDRGEETYGRSSRRESEDDDDDRGGADDEREGRYEDDDDGGDRRERGPYGGQERDGYRSREREPYGQEGRRDERPSIWREIFENLEKLPLPRV